MMSLPVDEFGRQRARSCCSAENVWIYFRGFALDGDYPVASPDLNVIEHSWKKLAASAAGAANVYEFRSGRIFLAPPLD